MGLHLTGSSLTQLNNAYVGRTARAQHAPALGLYFPEAEGAVGNGTADDTAAVIAACAAVQAAGSGQVYLDSGKTYRCNGALALPYTGGSANPVQKPVRITSAGMVTSNGRWVANPLNGGATLDLRYDGTDTLHPAKIDTRGAGRLEIDHVNIISGGTDDFPIFQTTNTTAHIHHNFVQGNTGKTGSACKQDAFLFGGTTNTVGDGSDAPFQGYGGAVHDNFFDHIRRGFVGRTYCNSIPFERNTFSTTCGNDGTGTGNFGGAYELHGRTTSDFCVGNVERDNTIECVNYLYAVAMENAANNTIGPSGYWDAANSFIGSVYCGTAALYNTITDGYHSQTYPLTVGPNKTKQVVRTAAQSRLTYFNGYTAFSNPVLALGGVNGRGFGAMVDSGDVGMLETVAGAAGSPSYPIIGLRTGAAKSVADVVTTSGSTIITSATAVWTRQHEWMPIKGTGIPTGTLILRYISATSVELTAAATATATGVTVQYGHPDGEINGQTEIQFTKRHMIAQGTAPVAGAVPSGITSVTITGRDMGGFVTVVAGASPPAAGAVIANINHNISYTGNQHPNLTARDAATAGLGQCWAGPSSNNAWQIGTGLTALTAGATYKWSYQIIQAG